MWVTKLLISPVKKGFFAQKRPNLAQNWHFWSICARPCRLFRCPVDGSVGGCGARAVSHKTPIYFIFLEMVQRDDFYLPKSKRGRGGRRQPIWRAASVEEFDSGSLPRLVISSSRRRRLRSESLRRPGCREQARMKKRWGGDVF